MSGCELVRLVVGIGLQDLGTLQMNPGSEVARRCSQLLDAVEQVPEIGVPALPKLRLQVGLEPRDPLRDRELDRGPAAHEVVGAVPHDAVEALGIRNDLGRPLEAEPEFSPGKRDRRLLVAEAAEKLRPTVAIALYREQIEWLVEHRGRDHYRQACDLLKRVRMLHLAMGETEAWTRYLAAFKSQYRRLRALKNELELAAITG